MQLTLGVSTRLIVLLHMLPVARFRSEKKALPIIRSLITLDTKEKGFTRMVIEHLIKGAASKAPTKALAAVLQLDR